MQTSRFNNLLLSILGGLLLWAAWPPSNYSFLVFFAWIPYLFVVTNVESKWKFFGYTFLHMLVWNVLTTWWIANASTVGGISGFFVNSFFMCLPWMAYRLTARYLNEFLRFASIILYWLAFEYLHQNWDLSFPWLTLGNVFATHPNWIQWYEYTGTSGGSLWVLLSNVLMFYIIKLYRIEGRSMRYFKVMGGLIVLLLVPILFSFTIKSNLTLHHNKFNVVVVQPNVDPWDEKFVAGKQEAQLHHLINLSQKEIDDKTALVVWPETAIPVSLDETRLRENLFLTPLWGFLKNNPKINLLTGIEGYKIFDSKISRFARKIPGEERFYEGYNSAALFDSSSNQIYHKSRLVPGAEVLPWFVSFMAPAFEKFGGTAGGYARDSSAKLLKTTNRSFSITPAICYESIYGDFLSGFNRKGSDLVCVITNDGWWGNTPGYKQHMNYARLRAIESRKWVARSANTGISCFIDPYGKVVQQLPWNQSGALKQDIAAFTTETFFTRFGDLLSKFSVVFTFAFFIMAIVIKIKRGKGTR